MEGGLKKIEDIKGLIDSLQIGVVDKPEQYQDIIIKYMESRMANILADRKKGVTSFYANNYFVQFGILYFLGEITDIKMRSYLGVNDEYDLFVGPEFFDFTKFRPAWLKNYSDNLLDKIAQNEHIRPHIIEVLKERIKNTRDKEYFEIFMNHFVL